LPKEKNQNLPALRAPQAGKGHFFKGIFLIFFKNQETVHKILKFLHACLTCVLQAGLQNLFTPARLESFRRGFYSHILLKKNDLNYNPIKLIAILLSIIHVI
jgi:hypothetical protein